MHDIQHLSTDGYVRARNENAISDACRGNADRWARETTRGVVTFRPTVFGHEATLRDAEGIVVTIATVDEFDV